jgi:streptomycin 6-kinase
MGERTGTPRGAPLGFASLTPSDLARLASVAAEVADEWDVELGRPFALARYSYVAPVGDSAVLKVTPPEDDESDEEAEALELWDGNGAVRLVCSDRRRRAMLIERARPGTDLAGVPEEEALAIAVDVGCRLWRRASDSFRWIGDHVPRWLDNAERDGRELVPLARTLYTSLDVGRETLVHGDFHHHNLLAHRDRWVAIDPKPMRGEAEYDVYSFLVNPLGSRMRLDVTERRLAAFADAGLDEGRMRAWAVIRGAFLCTDEHRLAVLRALL